MTTASEDQLLTPQQVADLLAIPRATLYSWRHRGKGPEGLRVGRHLRYRQSEVKDWLEEQEALEQVRAS